MSAADSSPAISTPSNYSFKLDFRTAPFIPEPSFKEAIHAITGHPPEIQILDFSEKLGNAKTPTEVHINLRLSLRVKIPGLFWTCNLIKPTFRPTINQAALRARLQAAMTAKPDAEPVVGENKKREAAGSLEEASSKRPRFDHVGEDDKKPKREDQSQPDVDRFLDSITLPQDGDTPGWTGGDMTLTMYGNEHNNEQEDAISPSYTGHHEARNEAGAEDEGRIQSDILLAEAYREMSAASESMAQWSKRTAEALEAKLAASRLEFEAATETLRAQARYEQATARIGQAVAHRGASRRT